MSLSQIPVRSKYLRTIINTVWLYPMADIEYALAHTSYKYTFDGVNIVSPDIANLSGVYRDIYNRTSVTQPIGNPGYSLGVGTLLEDLGKEIFFKLPSGETVVQWRLVKQLTPQTPPPNNIIPTPGDSPAGTVGFTTVFVSILDNAVAYQLFDTAYVVRVG